jgi:hypothetical protein
MFDADVGWPFGLTNGGVHSRTLQSFWFKRGLSSNVVFHFLSQDMKGAVQHYNN